MQPSLEISQGRSPNFVTEFLAPDLAAPVPTNYGRVFYPAQKKNPEKNHKKIYEKDQESETNNFKLAKNIDIYVVRISNTSEHQTVMSKPCKYCIAFLKSIGIRRVYYSLADKQSIYQMEEVATISSSHLSNADRTYRV